VFIYQSNTHGRHVVGVRILGFFSKLEIRQEAWPFLTSVASSMRDLAKMIGPRIQNSSIALDMKPKISLFSPVGF
jgi:hypothetical protein